MKLGPLCLAASLGLVACTPDDGPSEPYAFVGTWDCGTTSLTFTNSTYSNGRDSFPIASVAQDGRNFTLRFATGDIMSLVAVTETGLTRVSGRTGAQVNCRRAG
jgi:hypothetical protein